MRCNDRLAVVGDATGAGPVLQATATACLSVALGGVGDDATAHAAQAGLPSLGDVGAAVTMAVGEKRTAVASTVPWTDKNGVAALVRHQIDCGCWAAQAWQRALQGRAGNPAGEATVAVGALIVAALRPGLPLRAAVGLCSFVAELIRGYLPRRGGQAAVADAFADAVEQLRRAVVDALAGYECVARNDGS